MSRRYDPQTHHRRSIRLRGYDYARAGAYFVTIVVQDRVCLFGEVVGDEVQLSVAGRMVQRVWRETPRRFPGVEVGDFVVMPNHVHGIVWINHPVGAPLVGARGGSGRATARGAPTTERAATRVAQGADGGADRAATRAAPTALGGAIGAYKSLTTVEYVRGVKTAGWPPFNQRLWQRNYYEHIARDDESLTQIRQYIYDNPVRWSFDPENPLAVRPAQERTCPAVTD